MPRATWNGAVIAESEDVVVVEGNTYFPRDSVHPELLAPSNHTSACPWKGQASYYAVVVDGQRNPDAAWEYRDPKPAAAAVRDRIAFWRGGLPPVSWLSRALRGATQVNAGSRRRV